ncbi:MAG: hypothetical protein HGA85_09370, partial [Nanoarchaeota archaeon]|nr:hypothetical protein [Nanoarchaeota archaeon]
MPQLDLVDMLRDVKPGFNTIIPFDILNTLHQRVIVFKPEPESDDHRRRNGLASGDYDFINYCNPILEVSNNLAIDLLMLEKNQTIEQKFPHFSRRLKEADYIIGPRIVIDGLAVVLPDAKYILLEDSRENPKRNEP